MTQKIQRTGTMRLRTFRITDAKKEWGSALNSLHNLEDMSGYSSKSLGRMINQLQNAKISMPLDSKPKKR
jgi:hypothetical protein